MRELLDIFARLMPDPTEGNPPRFRDGEGSDARAVDIAPDPDRHVVAHVFAIANDPFRGKLALFRIHQGRISPNTQLYIGDARKPFRVSHLLRPQGRNQVETPAGVPGDLCAVARVDDIHLGDVLHDSHDEDALHLEHPPYPQPVFGLTLIPHKHGDEQKLSEALARLVDEDPCIQTGFDAQTRHIVVRGLGELHLRIVQAQLQQRWNLQFDTAPPAVPYRETITGQGEARHRHKKQSGGAGQFGEVALRVEALPRGAGIELGNEVKGGAIPTNFLPAVEKGVRQALDEGAVAGFPVQDVRVVLLDGKHHPVDSNEVSFVTAGRAATLDALLAARPIVLEPLVEIALDVDEHHFGEVSAEFSARRGRITGTETAAAGLTRLVAAMPLAELDGFEARLKAILAGSSTFTLVAAGFEPAPPDVQKKLASARGNGG
jgi:elongation factor G